LPLDVFETVKLRWICLLQGCHSSENREWTSFRRKPESRKVIYNCLCCFSNAAWLHAKTLQQETWRMRFWSGYRHSPVWRVYGINAIPAFAGMTSLSYIMIRQWYNK